MPCKFFPSSCSDSGPKKNTNKTHKDREETATSFTTIFCCMSSQATILNELFKGIFPQVNEIVTISELAVKRNARKTIEIHDTKIKCNLVVVICWRGESIKYSNFKYCMQHSHFICISSPQYKHFLAPQPVYSLTYSPCALLM